MPQSNHQTQRTLYKHTMDKQFPLISIIIPVFNTGKYLKEALESALSQDYPNIEIIAVDDGSTDAETLQILNEFASKQLYNLKIERLAQNQGVGYARNLGVDISQGEFFSFLDSDDRMHPHMLTQLYQAITTYSADFAMCAYQNFSNELGTNIEFESSNFRCFTPNKVTYLDDFIKENRKLFSFPTIVYGKLINKQLYQQSQNRFREKQIFEDVDWCVRLALSMNSFVFVDEHSYKRLLRPNSIVHNFDHENRLDMFSSQSCVWSAIKEHGLDQLYKDEFILTSFGGFEYRFNLMRDKSLKQRTVARVREFLAEELGIDLPPKPTRLYRAWHHVLYKLSSNHQQKIWHKIAYHYAKMYLKCHY